MAEIQVNIHEAKTHLSRLIEKAEAGERVVIAKAGKPKVVLTTISSDAAPQPGRFAGKIRLSDDFDGPLPDEELRAWEKG